MAIRNNKEMSTLVRMNVECSKMVDDDTIEGDTITVEGDSG
jgi:hypothetical protein